MVTTSLKLIGLLAALVPSAVVAQEISASLMGIQASDGMADAVAIQEALRVAKARGYRTLRLPAGEYLIDRPISAVSGMKVVGAGCGRTIFRRASNSRGQMMIVLDGVDDVAFYSLSFEHDGAPQFYRSIGFRGRGSHDVRIKANCFNDDQPITARGDRWAIELSATQSPSSDIVIQANHVSGAMQLTAGGGAGLTNVFITRNSILNAQANAIAVSTLSNRGVFQNINILDNNIINPAGIGIFLGPDQKDARGGSFSNVLISRNVIKGVRSRFGYGIFIRAAYFGNTGITINHNILDGGTPDKKSAIRLTDDHGEGRRTFTAVKICGNAARNFSRGIWLENVKNSTVVRNEIRTPRPLLISKPQENGNPDEDSGTC